MGETINHTWDYSDQWIKNWSWNIISASWESINEALLDLTWLPDNYRKVTNTSKKDVRMVDTQGFLKFVIDNETATQIFEILKESGLKIYVNDKTDLSYTKMFNIIMWMSENVTEQSKYSMNLVWTATAQDVHKTKFIHEMCHSIVTLCEEERNKLFSYCLAVRKANFEITKLWNLDRYESLPEKAKEDVTEFLRMYVQDSDNFNIYLWKIFDNKKVVNLFFQLTWTCIDKVIKK